MRRIYIFFIVLFLGISPSFAQYVEKAKQSTKEEVKKDKQPPRKKSQFSKNLVKGGNFGMQFKPFSLDLSPTLGYKISKNLLVGVGASYVFTRSKEGEAMFNRSIYSGRLYIQPSLVGGFFATAEYEAMNVPYTAEESQGTQRIWLHNPQLGAGFSYPLGKLLKLNMTVLYNLNYQKDYSPLPSPWRFRLGFSF